jgi:phosphoglycolate phosphatase
MGYDTVLFDLDGTLLDTLDDLMDSCNHALSTIGAPPRTRQEVRRFVGNGIRNLMRLAVPEGEDNPRFEEAYETMQSWYREHNQIKTAPYPGVQALIRTLKDKGVPMAVVSNKPDSSVQMLMRQWFPELTVGVGELEGLRRKPERDLVDYALERLGPDNGRVVYVGDSEVDLATAANAELDCITVTWGFRDRELLEERGATRFADTVEELLDWIIG